jgi:hypothetical protein
MENSSSSLGFNISTAPYLDDDYMIVATDKYADLRRQTDIAFIHCQHHIVSSNHSWESSGPYFNV